MNFLWVVGVVISILVTILLVGLGLIIMVDPMDEVERRKDDFDDFDENMGMFI